MEGGGEEVADDRAMNISLKDLSKKLEEFAKARDWEKYHSPRNLLLAMVIKTSSILIFEQLNFSACMHEFVYEFSVDYQTLNILFIYLCIYLFFILPCCKKLTFVCFQNIFECLEFIMKRLFHRNTLYF